jgi:hypothetical protein
VPILIGRPAVIAARIAKAGLRMQPGKDVEVCNPEDDPRFRQYWEPTTSSWAQWRVARSGQGRRAPLQHHHRLADGDSWATPTP